VSAAETVQAQIGRRPRPAVGATSERRNFAAVFVSYSAFLKREGGGVQACTREYLELLQGAGFSVTPLPYEADRRAWTRLRRLLGASPYFNPHEPGLAEKVDAQCNELGADWVFLNQATLAPLATALKAADPHRKVVVLSHGLESTDLLHTLNLRKRLPLTARLQGDPRLALGDALMVESRTRAALDAVCALSPFDADLERWLGAKQVLWLPRTVAAAALDWRPIAGRFGFVGTLDHAPNLEGLIAVLDVLDGGARVRIVGGPAKIGRWLAAKFKAVDYLGPLDDGELRDEAATWNAFLHPIFLLARGCSTKLATALSWRIPVVTTELGRRGYVWRKGALTIADTPRAFAECCVELTDLAVAARAREAVVEASLSSPSIAELSETLRQMLSGL
jgi:Glycosyl transferases group 1